MGQFSSLAVFDGRLFVGTQGGLFQLGSPDDDLRPVAGLARKPILRLSQDGDGLQLVFGDMSSFRLAGWDNLTTGFRDVKPLPAAGQAVGREFYHGFLVTARVEAAGNSLVATVGGGLFRNGVQLPDSPDRITALESWENLIAVAHPDGLLVWDPSLDDFSPLFQNPVSDCRVTSMVDWQGAVYAGTLSGGVFSWPAYAGIGEPKGLEARVNALAATPSNMYIGTEAGMATWNGSEWRLRDDITAESVKSLAVRNGSVYFTTPRGLKRFDPHSGRVSHLTTVSGAFMTTFQGDIYLGGMYGVWHVDLTGNFGVRRILHENTTGFAQMAGDLFATGYYTGLWQLTHQLPRTISAGEFSCIASSGADLWLGSGSSGIWNMSPTSSSQPLNVKFFSPADNITALLVFDGRLYVGTPVGVATAALDELRSLSP